MIKIGGFHDLGAALTSFKDLSEVDMMVDQALKLSIKRALDKRYSKYRVFVS